MGGLLRRSLFAATVVAAVMAMFCVMSSTGCDNAPPAHKASAAGEGEEKSEAARPPESPVVNLPPAPTPNTAPLSITPDPSGNARTIDRELGVGKFSDPATSAADRKDLRPDVETATQEVMAALASAGLPENCLTLESIEPQQDATASWTVRRMVAQIPKDKTLADYVWPLTEAIKRPDITVRAQLGVHGAHCLVAALPECRSFMEIRAKAPSENPEDTPKDTPQKVGEGKQEELPSEAAELESHELNTRTKPQRARKSDGPPRLAIILDDGGYPGAAADAVLALDPALTLSILPGAPSSGSVAKRAATAGFEVMLHMPMAPLAAGLRYPGQVSPEMSADEIRRITLHAIEQIPNAKGVNNHTGSKFTTHSKALKPFMAVMAEKGLYFVDSRTTAKSVAFAAAQKAGIRATERDVFLDHSNDPASIRSQLARAVKVAKQTGSAVAIGHFRTNTARVLAEELPKLKEDGVRLVHASALAE